MKIYKKHDDSATLSESMIIISNNIEVCNKNNYIKINKQNGSKTYQWSICLDKLPLVP